MKVTKKLACELAGRIIGIKKLARINEGFYVFEVGELIFEVSEHYYYASRDIFKYFNVDGKWCDGPVVDCTLYAGANINEAMFFQHSDMKEIIYEWGK